MQLPSASTKCTSRDGGRGSWRQANRGRAAEQQVSEDALRDWGAALCLLLRFQWRPIKKRRSGAVLRPCVAWVGLHGTGQVADTTCARVCAACALPMVNSSMHHSAAA